MADLSAGGDVVLCRFIFGGENPTYGTLGDIWVLSLPAFRWFRPDISGPARMGHQCAVVGKRQLLVVGGQPSFANRLVPPLAEDPWEQGLGVMDMTSLSWSSQYTPSAQEYDAPDLVRAWYASG